MVRPFWKMKRIKFGIPVLLVLALGLAGYKIGMNLASEKMVNELASQMTKEDYDNLLKDPSVQQIVAKELGSDKISVLRNNVSSDPTIKEAINKSNDTVAANVNSSIDTKPEKTTNVDSSKKKDTVVTVDSGKNKTEEKQPAVEKEEPSLQFKSSSEVMKFMLSKFSMSELSAFAKKAEGGVTTTEKKEIKNSVLGRLTTEEYNAVKVFAVLEMSKRQ